MVEGAEQGVEPTALPQDVLAEAPLAVEVAAKAEVLGARARSSAHGVRAFTASACSR